MTVEQIINLAKDAELDAISNKAKTDAKVLGYLNLGLIELYSRFNVSIKAEVLSSSINTNVYTLRNTDINQVISIYNSAGEELVEQSIEGSSNYDYKRLAYNTFLFLDTTTTDEYVFVYSSAPKFYTISDLQEEVEIPSAMIKPLLHYIGYSASIGTGPNNEASTNPEYIRFEASCKKLLDLGYDNSESVLSKDVRRKGFV